MDGDGWWDGVGWRDGEGWGGMGWWDGDGWDGVGWGWSGMGMGVGWDGKGDVQRIPLVILLTIPSNAIERAKTQGFLKRRGTYLSAKDDTFGLIIHTGVYLQ